MIMTMQQHTIKHDVSVKGIGLHSGKPTEIVLKPAPLGTGIVFRRKDVKPSVSIKASPDKVHETMMCTVLSEGDIKIATIEHLMAALSMLCIDNVFIDVYGAEIPVMDGSAAPFIFAIKASGVKEQHAPRTYISIKKPIRLSEGDAQAALLPCAHTQSFELSIDFDHPVIRRSTQSLKMAFNSEVMVRELSRARTFGFIDDLDRLKANQLALGASLDNAVGLAQNAVLNPEGLRYKDEFVRHKLLDAMGDLYVLGPIEGAFVAHKTGHKLNNLLIRTLLKTKDAWEVVN